MVKKKMLQLKWIIITGIVLLFTKVHSIEGQNHASAGVLIRHSRIVQTNVDIDLKRNITSSFVRNVVDQTIPSSSGLLPRTSPESDTISRRKLQTSGMFTGRFHLVKAEVSGNVTLRNISRGSYMNGAAVNISSFFNDSLSLYVGFTGSFTNITILFKGFTQPERSPPYSLKGRSRNNFVAVPDLKVPGLKTIILKSYNGSNAVVASLMLNFTVIAPPIPMPISVPAPSVRPRGKPSSLPIRNAPPIPVSPGPLNITNGQWIVTNANAPSLEARHEACFVMVGRKAVLLGGRGNRRPNIYNPVTRKWTLGATFPFINIRLNHMQCVAVDNKVWIVAAWTGGYPRELNAPFMYIYDPVADKWETRDPMPLNRRRGSTAVVAIGKIMYVAFDNSGGHETINHAVSYAWLDMYNTTSNRWTVLPDAKYPRDHTGGAFVNGRLCVGGGRDGGTVGWPLVPQTECYNLTSQTWSVEANVPRPRAGSAYGSFDCLPEGGLLMAGGEIFVEGVATTNFDLFNGTHWIPLKPMNIARHSTGLAVDCECNAIYVASGSGRAGGSPELLSVETYFFSGQDTACRA